VLSRGWRAPASTAAPGRHRPPLVHVVHSKVERALRGAVSGEAEPPALCGGSPVHPPRASQRAAGQRARQREQLRRVSACLVTWRRPSAPSVIFSRAGVVLSCLAKMESRRMQGVKLQARGGRMDTARIRFWTVKPGQASGGCATQEAAAFAPGHHRSTTRWRARSRFGRVVACIVYACDLCCFGWFVSGFTTYIVTLRT